MRNFLMDTYENYGCGWFIFALVLTLGLLFGAMCLEAWIIMLLWNAVMPCIWATAPTLSFWVSFGLMWLCHLLFIGVSSNK